MAHFTRIHVFEHDLPFSSLKACDGISREDKKELTRQGQINIHAGLRPQVSPGPRVNHSTRPYNGRCPGKPWTGLQTGSVGYGGV